jgi:NAD(P)H-dependent flavin oxidoreductase YrpB (nitropropane dioxygenase family)
MMNVSSPRLAAAVTNAGGFGVMGGTLSPERLADNIDELRSYLNDKNAPFGVDFLFPKVGGGARKTK